MFEENYPYQMGQLSKTKNMFPNFFITEEHLKFFYKYGFMVIKGMYSPEQIKTAQLGAEFLLNEYSWSYDGGAEG